MGTGIRISNVPPENGWMNAVLVVGGGSGVGLLSTNSLGETSHLSVKFFYKRP